MEDLLLNSILMELKNIYNSQDEEKVLKIFFLRSMIYNLSFNLDNENILNFLYRELNLPLQQHIIYNNKIIKRNYYGYDDSIESIIDNLKFKILEKPFKNVNNTISTIEKVLITEYKKYLQYSKKELKGLSKSKYYNYGLKHLMFLQLYKEFDIDYIRESRKIQEIQYDSDFLSITYDLECNRYYHELISKIAKCEKELEDFIYYKYHKTTNELLFDDIKILHRQFKVKNGIIDLLGKDKKNNIVIIELKVVKRPIDIFYQLKAYTDNIKELFNIKQVKFIAITPKLTNDIFEELMKEDISLYNYTKKNKEFNFKKII